MSRITELVTMKAKEGIETEAFIGIIDRLERNFHSKQDGFLDTELLYDENGNTWIMVQHWQSIEQMKASSANMFQDNVTLEFRGAIEPKEISIRAFPVSGSWQG